MKQHEREYFVSRIRSGVYYISINDKLIYVRSPTLEDEYFINEKFKQQYDKCLDEGLKTEDETVEWMRTRGLWTQKDDEREIGLEKDIERLKKEIYQNRHRSQLREQIRLGIRAGERQLGQSLEKKSKYFSNSCEGIANLAKVSEFFARCCYHNDSKCDIDELGIEFISKKYYNMILTEKEIRELSRSEPWRSIWVLRDSNAYNIFQNRDTQPTPDQKSMLVWSRMYDNVHESGEAPSDEVIDDNDLLDGWFAIQGQKKKDQAMESEIDDKLTNPKIANANEVFVMADNKEDARRINSLNSLQGQVLKKKRFNQIKAQGVVTPGQMEDERIEMGNISHQQYKDKFRS
jgi:hypothetical protein